ncbi:MAG: hypothetical protein II304_15150 [Bacteroidales bacterium]|nr:hypothetical protein [Bacteroidales bacterium]
MGFYVLANGEGSYITHDKTSNKYVPIRSLQKAKKWTTQSGASKILVSSISKSIRNSFKVEFYEQENKISKNIDGISNAICSTQLEECDVGEWLNKIQQISSILSGSTDKLKQFSEKLSDSDKQVVDFEHYIEFGKFNMYQAWLCLRALQTVLRQRRQYKNEIEILKKIKTCKFVDSDIRDLKETVEGINNKFYNPRVLPELFGGAEDI